MLSEKLLLPQVPQPIDSENGRPLSKLPPVAMQCAWSTITRDTGSVQAELQRALRHARCAGPPNGRRPGRRRCARRCASASSKSRARVQRQHRAELLAGERMRRADAVFFDQQHASAALRRWRRSRRSARDRCAPTGRSPPATACRRATSALAACAFCAASSSTAPRARSAASIGVAHRVDEHQRCSPTSSWSRCRRSSTRTMRSAARAHVGRLVDDDGDVAGADAEGRRAAGIGRAHVGLRAGGHHQVALAHQLGGACLVDRRRQQLHQVARRADAVELRMDEFDQPRAGAPALGRRRDDDRVAALQRVDDLVGRRGARVGARA